MGNRIHESQRDPLTGYPVFTSNDHTSSRSGGSGGGSDLELILQPNTSYVAYFENIGAATATDIDVDFFFYEESGY